MQEPGSRRVDVLVPTCDRPSALAATLATLIGQTTREFRVVLADQGREPAMASPGVAAAVGVLEQTGRRVEVHRRPTRRGIAEQRDFLLSLARAPHVLQLDDDVLCEPDLLERLLGALRREGCGFVGSFVNAPSAVSSEDPSDQPPPQVRMDVWHSRVHPEVVAPGLPGWNRRHLHFAAHPFHLCRRLGISRERPALYKVAWVGGCVLFDTEKLRDAGGYSFWTELPAAACGEDVVAQLRVMARHGGAGLAPSGAWHQEVPTTIPDRTLDAPHLLEVHPSKDDRSPLRWGLSGLR